MLKRSVDIILSLFGIIIVSPFLPFIALLIKMDSKGPVFYRTDRIGKNFKRFGMWKFRTMIDTSIEVGESISPQYDPRVTPLGRFLRRTKFNELPQLINILKGEMTFVGPRPEAPDLAELYPEEAKRVFSVKPGLVGPATILGRNEEEAYPPGVDVKKTYIENILPAKNKIDLEYIENPSFLGDLKYVLLGLKETMVGAISKRHIQDNRSQIYLILSDLFLIICSYSFAKILYFWSLSGEKTWTFSFLALFVVILTRLACNTYFGLYSSLIRYLSYHEIAGVFKGVSAGSLALILISYVYGRAQYPRLVAVGDWVILISLLSGLRFFLRLYWDMRHRKNDNRRKHRILIYGVCDEGNAACHALTSEKYLPYEIVGFIDDAANNFGKVVNGKKVLGNRHHIDALAKLYKVEEILIADPSFESKKLSAIMAICQRSKLKCRVWNPMEDFDSLNHHTLQAQSPDFSDILSLKRFRADDAAVRGILAGKTVLLNGSGGAVGLELCRRFLHLGCPKVIIIDRYEPYLNELVGGLLSSYPSESIIALPTDTDRRDILEEIFEKYRPSLVFHAGMRKYLPYSPVYLDDVGRNNYLRTFNLAKVAAKFQCDAFVMISSFMAAKVGNFIADSLRLAEISLEQLFSKSNTRLIIARICDIAENRGGVVSNIENQIRNKETLVLPSDGAQINLISKFSAAEFILQTLVEAGKSRSDGEAKIFSCDAGSPIPLINISERLANIYGFKLGSDVAIRYTGQLDGSGSMSPQVRSLATPLYSPITRDGIDNLGHYNEEMKSLFKEFAFGDHDGAPIQDWKSWTQKAIKLSGPVSSS